MCGDASGDLTGDLYGCDVSFDDAIGDLRYDGAALHGVWQHYAAVDNSEQFWTVLDSTSCFVCAVMLKQAL